MNAKEQLKKIVEKFEELMYEDDYVRLVGISSDNYSDLIDAILDAGFVRKEEKKKCLFCGIETLMVICLDCLKNNDAKKCIEKLDEIIKFKEK